MDDITIAETVNEMVENKFFELLEKLKMSRASVGSESVQTPVGSGKKGDPHSEEGVFLASELKSSRVGKKKRIKPRKEIIRGEESSEDGKSDVSSEFSDTEEEFAGEERRYSALRNVIAPKQREARQIVSVQQENYKGARLERLNVSNVLKFIDDVNRYQAQWQVRLNTATYVSDSVKRTLISRSRGRLTEGGFYRVTTKDLLREIQRAVRPQSILAFSKVFEDNIAFILPDNFIPSAVNLDFLYDALLLYRDRVLLVYDFLSKHNTDNVPLCNDKEGGLMKIFTDKIPFEYGTRIMRNLKTKRFDDLESFINAFMEKAKYHMRSAKEAKETMRFFKIEPKMNQNNFKAYGGHNRMDPNRHKTYGGNKRLNNMRFKDEEDDWIVEDQFMDDAKEEISSVIEDTGDPIDQESEPELSTGIGDQVNNIGPVAKSKACFQKLFYGRCNSVNCNYTHDRAFLEEAHADYMEKLKKSEFARKSDKGGILANVEIERMLEDPIFLNEDLLFALPEAVIHPAVNKPGVVKLDNGEIIHLEANEVLFDSGALHASYISEEFLLENLDILENYVKMHNSCTIMADKSKVQIKRKVSLNIEFVDSTDTIHVLESDFLVMPKLSYKIIVGLPDIVKKIGSLYKDMLDGAMVSELNMVQDLMEPWTSTDPNNEAIEEINFPVPCAFTDALHYMEMSEEEARSEYFNLIESHVSKEMRENTDVVRYLQNEAISVFVPSNWNGINGIEPIEFKWKEDLPERMKPPTRPVNPRLFANAKSEFERLKGYFYEDSDSPIASCLVIAPKATFPFIRFCGDYVKVNKYIISGHYPIPVVKHELSKIINYKLYVDIDLTNSYHQFKLGDITKRRLSVQTPWGQVQPMFMPEGVTPASGILQAAISTIFSDFDEWTIRIFDNMLILAHDYADAFEKLKKVIARCKERNVVLKFSKTWIGFKEVNFFGFQCKHLSYGLSEQRKSSIYAMVMPDSMKKMQSFLGTALFFSSFIPKYSEVTAPLHDMTKQDFNWDPSKWTVDYVGIFNKFKDILIQACELFYPDYNLDWVLRCDASDVAVAVVLLQIKILEDGTKVHQPLGFASEKLSDVAKRWPIYEKELYSIVFGVKRFDYELRCKPFVVETDHRNLQWLENSVVPKVMRWRIYLSSFNFLIRHIPGKENRVADWQSRMYHIKDGVSDILSRVHGKRMGHHGERRTWQLLNQYFPGHSIPYRVMAEYIAECGVCQKDRLQMLPPDILKPVVRHLKPVHARSVVGVDTLTVTPVDKNGYQYLVVVVNHFTKFCGLYPVKDKSAITTASALFQYFTSYGGYDAVISDPGSDLMSEVVQHLHQWLGIRHVFSLVDRHESNGVEGTNKLILRHLKAIIYDERVLDKWSDPSILSWVQYVLNSYTSTETGVIPIEATFGSVDRGYFQFDDKVGKGGDLHEYVRKLDMNLTTIREISKKFQDSLVQERLGEDKDKAHNVYQSGDLVLKRVSEVPNKLHPKYSGPYEVINQVKNDVSCRHIVQGSVYTFHVTQLKIFHGTKSEAIELAKIDCDQYTISRFLAYRGDPLVRTTMEFLILFEDGSEVWLPWSDDISSTIPFEDYCRSNAPLRFLIYKKVEADQLMRDLRNSDIVEVGIGDRVFVDLRCYNYGWYSSLGLPDCDKTTYAVEYVYQKWVRGRKKIEVYCPVFRETFKVDRVFVQMYGSTKQLPSHWKLVDSNFVTRYPQVKPKAK